MDVEALSVAEVERSVALCPLLKPFLDKNDKTPLTDGHIEVYDKAPLSNANRAGRVPVQVKGRTGKRIDTPQKHWNVPRVDLNGYLQESGVLYFFVRVNSGTGECVTYYANLAPFTITKLLASAPETSPTIPVPLTALPSNSHAIDSIVRLALRTRDQNPQAGIDPVLLEAAESFTFYSLREPNFGQRTRIDLDSGNVSLVLHTKGGMAVPLPGVLEIIPDDYSKQRVEADFAAGDTVYTESYRQRIDDQTVRISIGPGISLTLTESADNRSMKAHLEPEGSLADRIRACKFMLALNSGGTITVGGKETALGIVADDKLSREVGEVLSQLQMLSELFDALGVDGNLASIGDIDDQQMSQLEVLHRAIVKDEEVQAAMPGPGFVRQAVGPAQLVLFALAGESENHWRIIDLFSSDFRRQFWARSESGDGPEYPVTPYDCIEEEHVTSALNLRLDGLVGAYQTLLDWPRSTFANATQFVLKLLTASDTNAARADEFLAAAEGLNDWLLESDQQAPHHLVNRWQILHRRDLLTAEDRLEIRKLKHKMAGDRTHPLSEMLEIACAILLGESDEVEYLSSHIKRDDLERMRTWPIWSLYNG
ncbi:hypothetical protein [Demequina aestuarii]|uniref:hypothetical protein n=1 Tax=Demequina aestuarii TaxID=327095 RepID=UPI00128C470A|nr:hypothetical protein [Demequina aestuarii]